MLNLVNAQELGTDLRQNVQYSTLERTNLIVTRVGSTQDFQ